MSDNGSKYDYKFGPKNNWRREIWNKIRERVLGYCKIHPRDAVVLYLAGASDLDRPVATSKGFSESNLIAVDRSQEVVRTLRERGILSLDADLGKAIEAWSGTRVNVVFADLCSGLTESALDVLAKIVSNPNFENSILAINLMRGRENWSLIGMPEVQAVISGRHRGSVAFQFCLAFATSSIGNIRAAAPSQEDGLGRLTAEACEAWLRATKDIQVDVLSYKSTSGQVFDSSVFVVPNIYKVRTAIRQWAESRVGSDSGDTLFAVPDSRLYHRTDLKNKVARKIMAIRATRTRWLGCAP